MSDLVVRNLSKHFAEGTVALDGVGLEVRAGELVAVLGPSGSGKTTLLRLIAGLDRPTGGTIFLGSREITHLPPHKRDIALVFQDLALYPHLTVEEHLVFGLRCFGGRSQRPNAADVLARVREIAQMLDLAPLLRRFPDELSGGQQQLVALGRALAGRPALLLLDEPFSSLDAPLRRALRHQLTRLKPHLGIPILYVTHDAEEAMLLGDRLVVLDHGRVLQSGPPEDVYHKPANKIVAGLFGSEGMNFLRGQVVTRSEGVVFEAAGWQLPLGDCAVACPGEWVCGFHPESLRVGRGRLQGRVCGVETAGPSVFVHCQLPAEHGRASEEDEAVAVVVGIWDSGTLVGRPRPGDLVALHLELKEVQWFDPVSGQRLDVGSEPDSAGSAWPGVSVFPSQA